MEMDDFVDQLEKLRIFWIDKADGSWGYKHGQAPGIRNCAEDLYDLLDLVRQTKKG